MEIVLAHGASGNATSMAQHVRGLEARGLAARAIDLPVRRAETVLDAYRTATGTLAERVIGGHSYGGRVASLVAAGASDALEASAPAGLVLLSYPLHRPGSPDGDVRVSHWPSIRCPVLLLSGESDPFARIDLLRAAVARHLPAARLVTWPRLGHGLAPVLDEALDHVAAFAREVSDATWPIERS